MKKKIFTGVTGVVVALCVFGAGHALAFGKPRAEARAKGAGSASEAGTGPFSYAAYGKLLAAHVAKDGGVDYAAMKKDRAPLDSATAAMASLSKAEYGRWKRDDKIALWINAYNAYTLTAVLDHYPIQPGGLAARMRFPANSIRQIDGVWDALEWTVMGEAYTLEQIEHKVLRKEFADEPRVHMAIVCASAGCPPLRNEPFAGENIEQQLAGQSRAFLVAPEKFRIDEAGGKVYLSPIFKWFGGDFTGKYGAASFAGQTKTNSAVLDFISQHISEDGAKFLREGAYKIVYLDYDWGLNEQK